MPAVVTLEDGPMLSRIELTAVISRQEMDHGDPSAAIDRERTRLEAERGVPLRQAWSAQDQKTGNYVIHFVAAPSRSFPCGTQ